MKRSAFFKLFTALGAALCYPFKVFAWRGKYAFPPVENYCKRFPEGVLEWQLPERFGREEWATILLNASKQLGRPVTQVRMSRCAGRNFIIWNRAEITTEDQLLSPVVVEEIGGITCIFELRQDTVAYFS